MKELVDPMCPMFNTRCRHCSEESTHRSYTEIKQDPTTKLFIPIRIGKKKINLGMYCNDAGKWIEEMHYCTVMWGNSNHPTFTPLDTKPKQKRKVKKRTIPIVKPAKKPLLAKSRIARTAKVLKSKPSKKVIIIKKERVIKKGREVKVGKKKRTSLPDIIQL